MDGKRLVAIILSFAVTFLPTYFFERVANYYYLIDIPATFFLFSGLRLPLFILFAFLGSAFSGLMLRDLRLAVTTQLLALTGLLSAFYVFCFSPRVCYSPGPDGLEPLRLGLILGSLCVLGASIGVGSRARSGNRSWPIVLGVSSSFLALIYFPIVYTFAGARFFPFMYPWLLLVLVALLSFFASTALIENLGSFLGVSLPVLLVAVAIFLDAPMAASYLPTVELNAALLALAVIVGSLSAPLASKAIPKLQRGRAFRLVPFVMFLVLIIGSFWIIPDEVNGLVPQGEASGALSFAIGSPVYAGGFMDQPTRAAYGIAATVSFAGTNSSSIQSDNFLSAGIGAHSPDCCVDGIDYGYRFDLYLFHDGSESLLASAWQNCDDIAACGGHSWKHLMFNNSGPPTGAAVARPVYLQIQWEGHSAIWSYRVGLGDLVQFANFTAPAKENAAFNSGLVDVSSTLSTQKYALFYQFGIMSRYPLGRGGWSVTFDCPQTFQSSAWTCVSEAETAEGGYSFWKVLWRWGEDYPNVVVSSRGPDYFALSYSPTATMQNLSPLFS